MHNLDFRIVVILLGVVGILVGVFLSTLGLLLLTLGVLLVTVFMLVADPDSSPVSNILMIFGGGSVSFLIPMWAVWALR